MTIEMGTCLSLSRVDGFTDRQRIYSVCTSDEASGLMETLCREKGLSSADSILDFLEGEFRESPPTPTEVQKWETWNVTNASGTRNDYVTTSLLTARHLSSLKGVPSGSVES